ncbi:MAG: hypothetical protein ACOYN3_03855 [Acidimicrobiia bacterium]
MSTPSTPIPSASQSSSRSHRGDEIGAWIVAHWQGLLSAGTIIACGVAVLWVLQPDLILTNTTTAGGDTGAHVWWPAFLRDVLLPSGRLAGWSKDYYAGFPAGQFYFPVPALMIVVLNVVLPYNIAFKIVTAIGAVMMPACAYVFGRGLRVRFPGPAFMAIATLGLLFFAGDPRASQKTVGGLDVATAAFNQRIMGGTLASTLAGEFSFTIALCFALLFLGVFAATLRGGVRPGWAALLLALTVLSHLIVGVFVVIAALVVMGFRLLAESDWFGKLAGGSVLVTTAVGVFAVQWNTTGVFVVAPVALVSGAALLWFLRRDRSRSLLVAGSIGGVALLLSGIWTFPMLARFPYTSNMRYEKLVDLPATGPNELIDLYLFPNYGLTKLFPLVFVLGVVALGVAIATGKMPALVIGTWTAMMGVLFWRWPEAHAWNLRFLPFWYLGWLMLAGIGLAELANAPSAAIRAWTELRIREDRKLIERVRADDRNVAPLGEAQTRTRRENARQVGISITAALVILAALALPRLAYASKGFLDFWAEYNYTGYEWTAAQAAPSPDTPAGAIAKPLAKGPCNIPAHVSDKARARSGKSYAEFTEIMRTMESLPPGRALWEPSAAIDKYGTTLALELLPYCTNHRISSMEGLYFEASGTTAYHFISVSELAAEPSNPMRFPTQPNAYGTMADFDLGVRHLQALGVRYYMAQSEEAKKKADASPELALVAEVGDLDGIKPSGWKIYEVRQSPTVEALQYLPVVVTDQGPGGWQQSGARWLVDWFKDEQALARPLTADGPKGWLRATSATAKDQPLGEQLPAVEVTDVRETQSRIRFRVSQPGVPVVVKTSYYPAWHVTGAKGPYRASPNFMVVVPTSNNVTLQFERTGVDWLGLIATLVGIGLLIPMFLWVPPLAFGLTQSRDEADEVVVRNGDARDGEDLSGRNDASEAGDAPIGESSP